VKNFDDIIGRSEESKNEILQWYEDLYPLVYDFLSPPEAKEYRIKICAERSISARTLRRHVRSAKGGVNKLFRQPRSDKGVFRKYDPRLTTLARDMLTEFPRFSLKDVLSNLRNSEDEGVRTHANAISVSTLYQQVIKSGYNFSKRHTGQNRRYHKFEAPHAHALWQGDAKDGIWLPDPANPEKKRKTYLFAWIDDFSRKIMHAKYYFDEQLPRLEDCFRQAALKWGLPLKIYCDNGSVYISKHFAFLTAELDIVKIHHRPYHAWAKGKIEKWNRHIDKFQCAAAKAGIMTIEELNEALQDWIEVEYHSVVHGTTGETPNNRFKKSIEAHPPRRVSDNEPFNDLFLQRDTRVVDKYGLIHLYKNEYRVPDIKPGSQVEVRFSPYNLKRVKIFSEKKLLTVAEAKKFTTEKIKQPEESRKPDNAVSRESVNYFSRLREQHQNLREKDLSDPVKFSNVTKEPNNDN
jgi:hypothetical protein